MRIGILDMRYILVSVCGAKIYAYVTTRTRTHTWVIKCARICYTLVYMCACACVWTITGDRALMINILFNMRRLRGNNYEEFADIYVCVCWRSHTDIWNKQDRSGTYARTCWWKFPDSCESSCVRSHAWKMLDFSFFSFFFPFC